MITMMIFMDFRFNNSNVEIEESLLLDWVGLV